MDFSHLRAFVMVARLGNLTRAAEQLHLTQPAVSLQIKALQAQLGLQLFSRSATGMTLSNNGAKLLPYAERILSGLAEMSQAALAMHSTLQGELAIGTILDPEFTRLGVFLKRLVETYPQVATRLQQAMSGTVLQQIRAGSLDVGFYLGPLPDDGKTACHSIELTAFTYRVVAPRGWQQRVAGQSWASLAALPWIWTPPESAHHRLLGKIFASHNIVPNKVALVDQEPSMLDLVKSGVGLSLIRDAIAIREAHAHGLVIADSVSVTTQLRFICQEKRKNEAMIAASFELISQSWR
ncbi:MULTISPECIES: LysR family transcriptional regulator [unclassified Undibacterium]|uniref:LysR family transcriptional regulator n=1 Tax=unclassified Undibacterium TaxID=2630295 RepID=UPI002AC9D286|nr:MULTISPECIES: LysR family transcriptional regulator [unclassified Undibacterium]MEB0137835.1 LysR family transcriptional regulator [Undibacterium sp. CCC2.1]MEB0170974.1 LysR family transcriptional regulator [Undibacterium sp. CCC1.1]MEB0175019.1 LysR family transcriptional regulator [Undibacterium sp. CCC3.4]MEB0215775.1 LysR family transcriptional regulator [Undibacterium sp. 5I2]WPX44825.1 LysR family transcriptional regulator [Undibacterium sp. CCC3.4]